MFRVDRLCGTITVTAVASAMFDERIPQVSSRYMVDGMRGLIDRLPDVKKLDGTVRVRRP